MNKYKQLRYDIDGAIVNGVTKHPQEDMRDMGYVLLDSTPQSVAECWFFTVEEFIYPMPEYLTILENDYGYNYWHNDCWEDCEYFKISNDKYDGRGPLCCWGGVDCVKEWSEQKRDKAVSEYHENLKRNEDFFSKYVVDEILSIQIIEK